MIGQHRENPPDALDVTLRRAIQKHDGVKIVSFDVFDTLLRRVVSPSHALENELSRLATAAGQRGLAGGDFQDLVESRMAWDAQTRHVLPLQRRDEWSTKDWLEWHAKRCGGEAGPWISLARRTSLLAEQESCSPAPRAREALQLAREAGLRVIAISDTWHDESLVDALLEKFELSVDAIFTSASRRKSKRNGDIFRVVERELGATAAEFLHIGDNWKGDYLRAGASGWRVASNDWVAGVKRRGWFRGDDEESLARALHAEPMGLDSVPARIGYEHLAPVLILFAMQQIVWFRRSDVDVVGFVARDGYLPQRVVELCANELGWVWPRRYLRLSRRTASLLHPDRTLESMRGAPGRSGKGRVGTFLDTFDLGEELRVALLKSAGVFSTEAWTERTRSQLRRALVLHKDLLDARRAECRERLRAYLEQNDVKRGARIGLVDVGWAGTIQDALSELLPSSKFCGVYLGVSNGGRPPSSRSEKHGLIRDDHAPLERRVPGLRLAGALRVWELVLREPTGTTRRLVETEDGVIAEHDAWSAEQAEEATFAAELLRGVELGVRARLPGVRALGRVIDELSLESIRTEAAWRAGRLCLWPTKEEAEALLSPRLEEAGGFSLRLGMEMWRQRTVWWHGEVARSGRGGQVLAAMNGALTLYGELERRAGALRRSGSDHGAS